MESTLEQLFDHWQNSFDELNTISDYKAQVKTTLYADGYRYNLEKFDWGNFPSNGPMKTDKESFGVIGFHEYGLNEKGLPCYVAFNHEYNKVFWEGFYTYNDKLVRYVEFCLNTGVPSALIRIEFENGRKASFQRITINGGGDGYSLSEMSKEKIIQKIKNDEFSIISTVTTYEYDPTGKIKRASSIHVSPGLGKFTSYDEYNYDKNQTLETIRRFFGQGTNRLTYCRIPENTTTDSVVESLATAMAKLIAETLASKNIPEQIAILELSYHYADRYLPLLTCQSVDEVKQKLANKEFAFSPGFSNMIQVEIKPVEKLYAQLEQMMDESYDMDLGRKMLRETASILTRNKLFGNANASQDFAAYAIDWSIEGHSNEDIEEILRECGADDGMIGIWKQKGFLPQ